MRSLVVAALCKRYNPVKFRASGADLQERIYAILEEIG